MEITNSKQISLDNVPVEILHKIAGNLPPKSVFDLVLCCRTIYKSCVNSTLVWQQSVQEKSGFPRHVSPLREMDPYAWKDWAVADAKVANQLDYEQENILNWLPQVIALYHEVLKTGDPSKFWMLSEPSYYEPILDTFGCSMPAARQTTYSLFEAFPTDPHSPIGINCWLKAQAGSFCVAANLISRSSYKQPHPTLSSPAWRRAKELIDVAPWFELQNPYPGEQAKLAIMLHTLGNRLAGLLSVLIGEQITMKEVRKGWRNGNSLLPSPTAIPFSSLMVLPPLFSSDTISRFSLCHVAAMAAPSFFEDGTWTGYSTRLHSVSAVGARADCMAPRDNCFDGFGVDNETVVMNHLDQPPRSLLNPRDTCIERHATFKLVCWIDERYFTMRSNHFQSGDDTHVIEMKVDSWTGLLPIVKFRIMYIPVPCSGVITPFGIIISMCVPGRYIWLWKRDWSREE